MTWVISIQSLVKRQQLRRTDASFAVCHHGLIQVTKARRQTIAMNRIMVSAKILNIEFEKNMQVTPEQQAERNRFAALLKKLMLRGGGVAVQVSSEKDQVMYDSQMTNDRKHLGQNSRHP